MMRGMVKTAGVALSYVLIDFEIGVVMRCEDRQAGWRLCAILLIAVTPCAAWAYSAKVTKVSDGDTLWVQPDSGGTPHKLRLLGLDAPELCQPAGPASRQALLALVQGARVEVQVTYHDQYGRGLARLKVKGQDLGSQLVQAGHAWSARWHSDLGPYAREEATARRLRRGLFAAPGPELPRTFRQRHGPCHAG